MKLYYLFPLFVIIGISEPAILKQMTIENNTNDDHLELNWNSDNDRERIIKWMENLTLEHQYAEMVIINKGSFQGKDILGIKFDIPTPMFKDKKVIFLESGIHGTEWLTPMATLYILHSLVDSRKGEDLHWLAQAYEWYFLPVVCPDGYDYNFDLGHQNNGILCDSEGREVTRGDVDKPNHLTRRFHFHEECNGAGADPNRNWDYNWKNASQLRLKRFQCSLDFPGDYVWSERCVRFTGDFIAEIGPRIHAYFSFHQNGPFLIVPYGDKAEHMDNYDVMVGISRLVARNIEKKFGHKYKAGNVKETIVKYGDEKNPEIAGIIKRGGISGSSIDWVKRSFSTPIVLHIELPDEPERVFTVEREALDIILGVLGGYDHKFPPDCPPCGEDCPPWCSFETEPPETEVVPTQRLPEVPNLQLNCTSDCMPTCTAFCINLPMMMVSSKDKTERPTPECPTKFSLRLCELWYKYFK